MVKAARLDEDSIMNSLRSGEFYASTGVILEKLEQGESGISLRVCQDADSVYTIRIVGADNVTLKETFGREAAYSPCGGERYFRATITSSSGAQAWTQPVFLK